MAVELTTEEFVEQLDWLIKNDSKFFMSYDIDRARITLAVLADDGPESFWSPCIVHLPNAEYEAFRRELERLVPEPDRAKGWYW
jgi:hypothetical protein